MNTWSFHLFSFILVQRGLHASCYNQFELTKARSVRFHIFGSLCYHRRDGEILDKMKEKGDAVFLLGTSTQSKAYCGINKKNKNVVVNYSCLTLKTGLKWRLFTYVLMLLSHVTTSNELQLLYSPMFSELLNGNSPIMSKSSAVHAADNPDKLNTITQLHTSTTTDVADPRSPMESLFQHITKNPSQVSTAHCTEYSLKQK
ncbi:hypothetical protein Tco_0344155 [Tanacetum coccineum]